MSRESHAFDTDGTSLADKYFAKSVLAATNPLAKMKAAHDDEVAREMAEHDKREVKAMAKEAKEAKIAKVAKKAAAEKHLALAEVRLLKKETQLG